MSAPDATAEAAAPHGTEMTEELARIAQDKRNWALAEQLWRALVAQNPRIARFHSGLASNLLAHGEYLKDTGEQSAAEQCFAEAAAIFQSTAILFPEDFDVAHAYADALTRLRDWPAALASWKTLISDFPHRPACHAGCGRALRESGALAEAAILLNAALARFPDDFETRLQTALTLSAMRDWQPALGQWASLKRRHPRDAAIRSLLTDVLLKAKEDQGAGETFEIPEILLQDGQDDESQARDLTKLFMKFESIGTSCEFGLVQRRHHAEPLGLLRWAAINPGQLIIALENRFAGVGEREHTIISTHNGEYITQDRRYYMLSHTFTFESFEPVDKFAPAQLRRMQFLRRKLLADLDTAAKIFLYKAHDGITDIEISAMHNAIRRYSDSAVLFIIRLADTAHPPGMVQRPSPNLFIGYAGRFTTVDPPVETWISLCRQVAESVA